MSEYVRFCGGLPFSLLLTDFACNRLNLYIDFAYKVEALHFCISPYTLPVLGNLA